MADEPHPGVEVIKKWMLTLADQIADQADIAADQFKNVPGDVALREFAKGIRHTNAKSGFIPEIKSAH
jgi:hypothetical protein